MKTQISQLKSERQNVKRVESLAMEISSQLIEDQQLLQPYLEAVLTSVIPNFGTLIQVDVQHKCFDMFLLAPEFQVLSVIVACLKVPQSRSVSAHYLEKWTKKKLFARTCDIMKERQNTQMYNELLNVIFSIPDRVAGAFGDEEKSKVPQALKFGPFFEKLAISITELDSEILSKFAVLKLMPNIWKTEFTVPQIAEAALGLTPSALSPFILNLLEEAPKQSASAILSVMYPKIDRVRSLLGTHFLTQKVLSDRALNILVDFLIGQGEVLSTLEKCGEIWSRHKLITQMSTSLHRQLSLAILRLLPKTTQEQLQHCKATSLIMSGVSAHISITSPEIRRFGLEIGERITAILLPDQAVRFDELHPKEEEDKDELGTRKPLNQDDDSDSSDVDIDAPFTEQQNSESSDDELVPYAIDDTPAGDDNKVLHPRELIALFRTDENDIDRYKKFSQAIAVSADIIKKMTQFEFEEFGAELLSVLLSVDNEYNDDDFEELRRNALVALMCTFPIPTAKLVVGELRKKRTHSLGRKIQLLSAISYAASEMSELPKPEKKEITIIEAHTRRWGRARTKITKVSAVNKFSKCATIYFYGMLNAVDLDKICVEEDGLEVAQTMTTLAIVVEAAGESVLELDQMCKDLLQVVLALTSTRPPNARRALLFATSCAVRALKSYRGNDLIGEYLVTSAEDDPDEMCRDLARNTCALLAERHDEDMNRLIPTG